MLPPVDEDDELLPEPRCAMICSRNFCNSAIVSDRRLSCSGKESEPRASSRATGSDPACPPAELFPDSAERWWLDLLNTKHE